MHDHCYPSTQRQFAQAVKLRLRDEGLPVAFFLVAFAIPFTRMWPSSMRKMCVDGEANRSLDGRRSGSGRRKKSNSNYHEKDKYMKRTIVGLAVLVFLPAALKKDWTLRIATLRDSSFRQPIPMARIPNAAVLVCEGKTHYPIIPLNSPTFYIDAEGKRVDHDYRFAGNCRFLHRVHSSVSVAVAQGKRF